MPEPHVLHDYIAGAVGGATGLVVGHPFDTTKVQMQTKQTSSPYKGTWDAIRNINKQGWSHGFFRGLGFPLVSYGMINSVFFGVYGNTLRWMGAGKEKSSHSDVLISGCVGGAAQLFIACPVDVVKVILQSQIPKDSGARVVTMGPNQPQVFSGPWQCATTVYRLHGLRGCYKGFVVMGCRDLPACSVYFLTYETLYRYMMLNDLSDRHGALASVIAGGMAGVVSWLIVMPLDVIKSQIQADFDNRQFKGTLDCFRQLYRKGGIRAFYTGVVVNSLRAFPVNAVTFLVYSQFMRILQRDPYMHLNEADYM